MGTNYYIKRKKCESCGHTPDSIHLGKSSFGWQFSFQYNGGIYYKNVKEMKEWLSDKKILDEYGMEVSNKDFWTMVDHKQNSNFLNHAEKSIKEYPHSKHYNFVIDGYSFTDGEFS